MAEMRIRPRFLVGAGLIAVAIGYLIFSAIRSTSEYYLTVDEVASRASELGGQPLRIAGRVKNGNIAWDPATLTLKFEMTQIPDTAPGSVEPVSATEPLALKVICAGEPKPDMFAPGRDVIVEGRLTRTGEVVATQVLTSCPSKYKSQQGK